MKNDPNVFTDAKGNKWRGRLGNVHHETVTPPLTGEEKYNNWKLNSRNNAKRMIDSNRKPRTSQVKPAIVRFLATVKAPATVDEIVAGINTPKATVYWALRKMPFLGRTKHVGRTKRNPLTRFFLQTVFKSKKVYEPGEPVFPCEYCPAGEYEEPTNTFGCQLGFCGRKRLEACKQVDDWVKEQREVKTQ